MAVRVLTQDSLSVRQPIKSQTEIGRVLLLENIFVVDNSPHVKSFPRADEFNSVNIGAWNEIIHEASYEHLLGGTENSAARWLVGKRKWLIVRQGEWQNINPSIESYFVGWSMAGIEHVDLATKFDAVRPILIESSSDLDTDIGAQLLSTAGRTYLHACSCDFGTSLDCCGGVLHGSGQVCSLFRLSDGLTNQLVSLFPGSPHLINRLPQFAGLIPKDAKLEDSDSGQNKRSDNEPKSEFYNAPIARRFFVAVSGLLGGFFISLRGWELFDKKRIILGSALIALGLLLGVAGMGLLVLTGYPSTWRWIL
ncbi:MAG TPA: hypothetical protein VNZ56_16975 [Verrucomicrobiae bacterium]|nr:hypothetical protein [Verrucomicrobiae bacterium]